MLGQRRVNAVIALAGLALTATSPVGAKEARVATRIVLDHVDVQPSYFADHDRVRLFVTAVTLEGGIIPAPGKDAFLFQIGAAKQRTPYLLGQFAGTEAVLAAAVVVEVGKEYEADLPSLSDALSRHLREWPRDARVVLVRYGQSVEIDDRPRNVRSVAGELGRIVSDLAPAPPQLLGAIEQAITALEHIKAPRPGQHIRKIIVVISDGKDASPEPANYRRIADSAKRAGIRIHTLGYSPVDNRRPLLGLGEMSKRSAGTFRWVRSAEGFDAQLRTLAKEISGQYVITFFANSKQLAGKKISISHRDLSSESLELGASLCGKQKCDSDSFCADLRCTERGGARTLTTWLIYGAAGLGALVVLLSIIGAAMRRSDAGRVAAHARAQQIMRHGPQGGPADVAHRVVAQGPQGQRIAPAASVGRTTGRGPQQQGRIDGVGPGGAVHATPVPSQAPAQARGYLTIVQGPLAGQRANVRHGFLIGTASKCDLRLPARSGASQYHAQIIVDAGGGAVLVDKGSANGTFVNGTRVSQIRLAHGHNIRIGSNEIRFLLD